VKKNILIAFALVFFLAACNRKTFVKKLVGTYTLSKYLYDGRENTTSFDTIFRDWKLDLSEGEVYAKTWTEYQFYPDTLFLVDTLGYDSIGGFYVVDVDTVRIIDTTKVARLETGTWDLINSEEDLQLRNDSTRLADIYRILELKKENLTLRKGNEELYLVK
jgi:hypothetical protein